MISFEEVLRFWFPGDELADGESATARLEWWFRGGTDEEILARFVPVLDRAARGELDDWAAAAYSRLALIIVLDQFSRTVFRGTPRAFEQDGKALALALGGLGNGFFDELDSPWKKTFFMMPLSHSEILEHHEQVVRRTRQIADEAPPALRRVFEHSANQARGHRDVIVRFGRHPHRNAVLGRTSTPEEEAYLASGDVVPLRSVRG